MRRGTSRLRIELTEYLQDGGSPVEVLEELARAMETFFRPKRGVLRDTPYAQQWQMAYESSIPLIEGWAVKLNKMLRSPWPSRESMK